MVPSYIFPCYGVILPRARALEIIIKAFGIEVPADEDEEIDFFNLECRKEYPLLSDTKSKFFIFYLPDDIPTRKFDNGFFIGFKGGPIETIEAAYNRRMKNIQEGKPRDTGKLPDQRDYEFATPGFVCWDKIKEYYEQDKESLKEKWDAQPLNTDIEPDFYMIPDDCWCCS